GRGGFLACDAWRRDAAARCAAGGSGQYGSRIALSAAEAASRIRFQCRVGGGAACGRSDGTIVVRGGGRIRLSRRLRQRAPGDPRRESGGDDMRPAFAYVGSFTTQRRKARG